MKRLLSGIVLSLALVLGSAGVASANIVWATLSETSCTRSAWDLWMMSWDPFWFSYFQDLLSMDPDTWLWFLGLGGNAYAVWNLLQMAPQFVPCW